MSLFSKINDPADLRKLSPAQFPTLAEELRSYILDVTSVNPGHLGASLGVVELTIALHFLFDTPNDKLIWDVGHQAYGHKILTGRKANFYSLRKLGGLSGFPVMNESVYDAFGTGHASTSVSAAVGMAVAAKLQGKPDQQHIAVIGDGAITGGMFFEALNQAGDSGINLLIILNDNGIAIDKSAGALKDYLVRQAEKHSSQAFSNPLFEAFGIACNGPVNGHNFEELLPALEAVKAMKGVRLLHVITTKGKGFEQAEKDQVRYHAPGIFDRLTGDLPDVQPVENRIPLYQEVFGETLLELAQQNPKIVGVTPAMPTGSHLLPLMEKFPDRCFDVGIAEQHALTFSAGLATQGLIPFCVIYSTFLQRAYDQLIHDIALQKLPVVLCIDRAGLVGEDGATHHGVFDLAYLRCIPNLIIAAPMNEIELQQLMFTASEFREGPFVIRYPRGKATKLDWKVKHESLPIGKGRKLSEGKKIALISIGQAGIFVQEALKNLEKENIFVSHYDLRFLKPLDNKLLIEAFEQHEIIITVEDGAINGGMGSALMEWAQENDFQKKIIRLGVPDQFVPHGKPEELQRICGFDAVGIVSLIIDVL
ncbi:MAG: 1-deoxy-D-xylulose-5-phosphate synthase [Bacteroidales bacterium]|nr:1-deoxy-D-xylulose-5-phosphate synthase [Bacteroidales bacterium]